MINNYPTVYKKLVVNKYNNRKVKIKELLDNYNISNGSLYNWIHKSKNNQSLDKEVYNKQSKYTPEIKCYIRAYVLRTHTFNCNKLITLIKKKYRITSSKTSIYRILSQMKIVKKKVRRKLIYNKDLIKIKRNNFKKTIANINVNDIISIDETSVDNQLYPLYGWSLKGRRIIMQRNAVKLRYSVIMAINNNKIIHYEIIKNSANAIQFKNFINTLVDKGVNNKYLLVDNARIHHSSIVKDYIKTTTNTLLYNAPYTPEFNPIEHVFSRIKQLLRTKINDSSIKIKQNIQLSCKEITKTELKNYYKKSLNK